MKGLIRLDDDNIISKYTLTNITHRPIFDHVKNSRGEITYDEDRDEIFEYKKSLVDIYTTKGLLKTMEYKTKDEAYEFIDYIINLQ